ncbi:hypothetical protein [Herbiconiux daphne]|uniref:Uncharacterized protein n=1 Tax=Herbiconiux daphne TaxID=2970914 RepID=A0ABT2H6L5_9MICO|nr:hypothetical protein [Herbiconiux daphne]MCS5735544.1 hypothetical protein [Herbiconiux daphne]
MGRRMIGFLLWRGVPQRLDPISIRSRYPVVGVVVIVMMVFALVRTIVMVDEIDQPFFAVAAILFVVVTGLSALVVTDPVHSPVGLGGFAATVAVANLASVSSSLSAWGTTNYIWSNWGPLVVGVTLVIFAEYRPGRDLAAGAAASTVIVGTTAAVETFSMPELASPLTAAVIASTPIVLFGVGAAVFSYRMSLTLSRESETRVREQSGLSRRVRIRLRELLRESGRDALSVEVVPFLEGILARCEVSADDAAQARRISAVMRSVLFTDMSLPWLQRMERAHPGELIVHDERAAADAFSMEQKAALRALLTALLADRREQQTVAALVADAEWGQAGLGPVAVTSVIEPVHVRINDLGGHRSVFLRMPCSQSEAGVRLRFGAFITVMNAVFGRSTVSLVDGELRLLFAYDS